MQLRILLVLVSLVAGTLGKVGFGPGEQEWGHVKVRPNAFMFWWLYYTTANVPSFYDKPLLIWLQGGPGASSTSYGNFEEIGPLDISLNPRNFTWVKNYNVLFIDNPVGAGFSYVEDDLAFAKTNAEIAIDLLECMKGFLKALPEFATVPTYILTESYGGKMGAEFALVWDKAQKDGTIESNLKGVGLGDSWISPIDSVVTWAPFLLATGMVDVQGFNRIDQSALLAKAAVEAGQWSKATRLWAITEGVIIDVTHGISFYNILSPEHVSNRRFRFRSGMPREAMASVAVRDSEKELDAIMNEEVKRALKLDVVHGAQGSKVFATLVEDFMKPVTEIVECLVNKTDLNVFVYTGQMDLIVDTPGTLNWVDKLKWKDSSKWPTTKRVALVGNGIIEGYRKVLGNFGMYWVNRAGHMVPKDNPAAMDEILKYLTSNAKL